MLKNKDFFNRIQYFNRKDFICKCKDSLCQSININPYLVYMLDHARSIADIPFIISSASRCKEHNKNIGGYSKSSHIRGLAVDININNSIDRFKILNSLIDVGFTRIGVYKDFIHVDIDSTKTDNVIWYK